MDIIGAIKGIVKRDIERRTTGQDCAACYEAFGVRPVGGKWTLGFDTQPIRYHWLADDRVLTATEIVTKTAKAICGAEVIVR